MSSRLVVLGALMAFIPATVKAQSTADSAGVRQAVLDYVNSIYNADTALVYRSVRPELAKRGYWIPRNASTYSNEPMTFAELVETARTWNSAKKDTSTWPKEVRVLDLLNQTASAKVTARWGIDYLHLAKYDGKWMIVNILWQSPPPK